MQRRVVVTGLGLISSLGTSAQETWISVCQNLNTGVVSIARLPLFEKMNSPNAPTYAAILPKPTSLAKKHHVAPFATSNTLFYALSLAASEEALTDAKIFTEKMSLLEKYRTGVIIGTACSDKPPLEVALKTLGDRGYSFLNKMSLLQVLDNFGTSLVSLKYQFKGYTNTPVIACSSSLVAIGEGYRAIKENYADTMVVGGAEHSVCPFVVQGFTSIKALSTKYKKTPSIASRPFDQGRDGFVLGDGAGILVLEVIFLSERLKIGI